MKISHTLTLPLGLLMKVPRCPRSCHQEGGWRKGEGGSLGWDISTPPGPRKGPHPVTHHANANSGSIVVILYLSPQAKGQERGREGLGHRRD